ncbi:glycerophosphodiester phosphodiesterase family protein, partial [Marinitenerispora sediminis]|uniref:glycerophosphodiester phosphodiesterase family protein n=1 Tax=Marinitenerispora sediminis TaxID=1931232 RepID=UPI002867C862
SRDRPPGRAPARRGLGQTFDVAGVENDTCTAERIHPPEHAYLENTVEGMRAAFDSGADIVELDVHVARDDQFAVFHDWEVDCRTGGQGTTRDHTMDELRQLDIGYGDTADGGATFPFHGTGAGLMPSLDEVFAEFPDEEPLIHVKSDDPAEGELLAEHLGRLPEERLAAIAVYGGDAPVAALRGELPGLRTMSKATLRDCVPRYAGGLERIRARRLRRHPAAHPRGHRPVAAGLAAPVHRAHGGRGDPGRPRRRLRRLVRRDRVDQPRRPGRAAGRRTGAVSRAPSRRPCGVATLGTRLFLLRKV